MCQQVDLGHCMKHSERRMLMSWRFGTDAVRTNDNGTQDLEKFSKELKTLGGEYHALDPYAMLSSK